MTDDLSGCDALAVFRAMVDNADAVVAAKSLDGVYLLASKEWRDLVGPQGESLIGKTDFDLFSQDVAEAMRRVDRQVATNRSAVRVEETFTIGGEQRQYLASKFPIFDADGRVVATGVIGTDISDRKRLELELSQANRELAARLEQTEHRQRELREAAIRDSLTGLYNRRYLEDSLEREIKRAERDGALLSVIMLDADHFKRVNDVHGHAAGDMVLKSMAAYLTARLRAGDIVCRFGGEEFVIVLPATAWQAALQVAEGIRVAVGETVFQSGGQEVAITLSLGVACFPEHGSTGRDVLAMADAALYTAKRRGRNLTCLAGQDTLADGTARALSWSRLFAGGRERRGWDQEARLSNE